jgi:hypothetical protein
MPFKFEGISVTRYLGQLIAQIVGLCAVCAVLRIKAVGGFQ